MSVEVIDFSCKHNVLIMGPDGSCIPMDEPYFESELISPGTWRIRTDGDAIYLVEGDNEAIVIDSGYGAGNLRKYCQCLTDKPVYHIVNTHDHFDHTANNAYFEKAYMSEKTVPLATIPFPSFEGIDFPRNYPIEVVREGDKIELGNRTLEVFELPDHAVGSIALLDSREKILFAGDEIVSNFKKINGKIEEVLRQYKKLRNRKDEIRVIWPGPGEACSPDIIDQYIETFEYILNGGEAKPGFGMMGHGSKQDEKIGVPDGVIIYERFHARPCDMKLKHELGASTLRHVDRFGTRIVFDDSNL